jgi:hypothetical protein
MSPVLDKEFKLYLKNRGIEIESDSFELRFWEPQSFAQYRQMAIDTDQIQVFSSLISTEAAKYISKRYMLMRYLGWTEDEVMKNEQMWKQENTKKVKDKIGTSSDDESQPGLSSVGIRPSAENAQAETEPETEPETAEATGTAGAGETTNALGEPTTT